MIFLIPNIILEERVLIAAVKIKFWWIFIVQIRFKLIIPIVYEVLRDLVLFVEFKKREKHPWRSVTFSKVAGI